jgi:hypothetical protein
MSLIPSVLLATAMAASSKHITAPAVRACNVISPGQIQRIMGELPKSAKPSEHTIGELIFTQCFYTLPTFTNSVSLAITMPSAADVHHDAARHLWNKWFHRDDPAFEKDDGNKDAKAGGSKGAEEEEETAKAEPVAGIGDEGFWVRSFVANLYIRKGNEFVRISIGGKDSPEARLVKAKELAKDALRRLP